jgi:hypothetical protein
MKVTLADRVAGIEPVPVDARSVCDDILREARLFSPRELRVLASQVIVLM